MAEVGVGIVGSGFVSTLHAEAMRRVPGAVLRGVTSPTPGHAESFAQAHGVPRWYTDYRALLDDPHVDVVCIGAPNHLHRDVAVAAAGSGKHVICEKPLARTLAEAEEMVSACRAAGVLLLYAEELCFAPKYVRAKQLVDEGALGRVFHVLHSEQHDGPHSDWFWDVRRSGGGVLMDMGCHAIELCRWMYDKPAVVSVSATLGTYMHGDRTDGDDHAVGILTFAGGGIGVVEVSWAKRGGMDDHVELIGDGGVSYVDLVRGTALPTFSASGYGYAAEKAPSQGWSYPMFDETWNYGYVAEMRHFVECVREQAEPRETGEDGLEVLRILYSMYRAAAIGRTSAVTVTDSERDQEPIRSWLEARRQLHSAT
jgi:predicted dehydrogenase